MISAGLAAFKLQFAITPIIFTGGSGVLTTPDGVTPISSLLNSMTVINGLVSDSVLDLDTYSAYFQPMPGSTLIEQDIGMYPFANQQTAANAVINKPLAISMRMICPAGVNNGGWGGKQALIQGLQGAFSNHNASGGTYSIMTPAFVYSNCVFLTMTDVSIQQSKQPQNCYQLDFIKPLISLADATSAQNNLMSKITSGLPTNGAQSGPSVPLGQGGIGHPQ